MDDTIVFHRLTRENLADIIDLQLANVKKLLEGRELELEVSPEAREFLVKEGYDPAYGARPLKRAIQTFIQNPLAMAVLEGRFVDGDTISVVPSADGQRLEFT